MSAAVEVPRTRSELTGMQALLADLARVWRPGEVIGRALTHDEARGVLRHTVLELAFIKRERIRVASAMHCVDGGAMIRYRVDGAGEKLRERYLIPYMVRQGLHAHERETRWAREAAGRVRSSIGTEGPADA